MKLTHLLFAAVLITVAETCPATDLRGQIRGTHAYTNNTFAVENVRVVLKLSESGEIVSRAWTGKSGYYYFKGVEPGDYELQISGRSSSRSYNFPITVHDVKRQSIEAIVLP